MCNVIFIIRYFNYLCKTQVCPLSSSVFTQKISPSLLIASLWVFSSIFE